MLEILFKQMRKDFSHQFVKKEVLHYYETQEYISSINTKIIVYFVTPLLTSIIFIIFCTAFIYF